MTNAHPPRQTGENCGAYALRLLTHKPIADIAQMILDHPNHVQRGSRSAALNTRDWTDIEEALGALVIKIARWDTHAGWCALPVYATGARNAWGFSRPPTFAQLRRQMRIDNAMVHVDGHTFAVIDGEPVDHGCPARKRVTKVAHFD